MTKMDIYKLFSVQYMCTGLINILLIDRVHNMNDDYLKSICKDDMLAGGDNVLIRCYYIIKYMTLEEGKKYMLEKNTPETNKSHVKTIKQKRNDKYNELLAFHFRPRGAHTKGANH
jgi:hypothetical protein